MSTPGCATYEYRMKAVSTRELSGPSNTASAMADSAPQAQLPGARGERGGAGSWSSPATATTERLEITANFNQIPAEHGGPGTTFTVRLLFSEAPNVSYRVLWDEAFDATRGNVRMARRVDGRDDLREIHEEPTGNGTVSIRLPATSDCSAHGAVCTSDKRPLANSPTATVAGPAGLSVADVEAEENADKTIDFTVTLDRAGTATVSVSYATAAGTAKAGADYTATSGTRASRAANGRRPSQSTCSTTRTTRARKRSHSGCGTPVAIRGRFSLKPKYPKNQGESGIRQLGGRRLGKFAGAALAVETGTTRQGRQSPMATPNGDRVRVSRQSGYRGNPRWRRAR